MFEQISLENITQTEIFFAAIGAIIGLIIGALLIGMRSAAIAKERDALDEEKDELEKQIVALQTRIDTERGAMDEHFMALASKVLESNSQNFLTLAEQKLKQAQKDGAYDLDKRSTAIKELVTPVQKHLETLSGAVKELHGTKQNILDDLRNLNKETSKLAGALRNPTLRGNWGEEMLERLLENSGLIKGVNYHIQEHIPLEEGRRLRPDAVINLPDSLHIVIDSKAPINDFIRNLDAEMEEADYKTLQTGLAQAVRAHIKELGKKSYWENLDSPDFVVLFLPSEHLFSAALQADPSLMDLAAENNIVLASPTLMMSLLRVVRMSWRQVELAKNAQDIAILGEELYDRICTFGGHMQKIGKGIEGAAAAYDKAISSLESRVLVSARKFKDMQASLKDVEIPEFQAIQGPQKTLSSQEFDTQDAEDKKVSNG